MSNRFFFLIVCCIVLSCSANNGDVKSKGDVLIDSLFSPVFEREFQHDHIRNLFNQIQKESDNITNYSGLMEFVNTNAKYEHIAMPTLVYLKHDGLKDFLKENYQELDESIYSKLAEGLDWTFRITDSTTHHKYNSSILDVLIPISMKLEDQRSRGIIFGLVSRIGTYKQVKEFRHFLQEETNAFNRVRILSFFLRFKDDEFDRIVMNEFEEYFDNSTIEHVASQGIQFYNRHDFLPFLYSLQTELENETDVRKIEDAKRTLERLNEAIPYLEQKKAEGVKPGLPLDWGVVD
ncbi:hypothetical protein QA601_16285 [Chitinispirillales bacterium ANBcel5]|uniref:hypothetical protein n=1 Tax=Cellulosispirillum alkaliphilum TaxID=3039283 RepID=UPI002A4E3E22|nr:hypothetical protein [Chitinispirillales bacterium ANBcel5]